MNLIWTLRSDGYVTGVIGMLDEDLLRDTPTGGIRRSARRGTRQLDAGFYGIGCPHPAVECLSAQLNKLIMHYGSKSCLGINLQAFL